jgi:Zn-dependent M32 family carboxypeptidase
MMNYALGAIIAAELRARTVELRGRATPADDNTWYPWVAERLFRYGLEKPSRCVIEDFLGRPPSPRARW